MMPSQARRAAEKTPRAQTFKHTFPSGNTATVRLCAADPWGQHCEWETLPIAASDEAEFVAWRGMIGREIADECGVGLAFALDFPTHTRLLMCAPGRAAVDFTIAEAGGAA